MCGALPIGFVRHLMRVCLPQSAHTIYSTHMRIDVVIAINAPPSSNGMFKHRINGGLELANVKSLFNLAQNQFKALLKDMPFISDEVSTGNVRRETFRRECAHKAKHISEFTYQFTSPFLFAPSVPADRAPAFLLWKRCFVKKKNYTITNVAARKFRKAKHRAPEAYKNDDHWFNIVVVSTNSWHMSFDVAWIGILCG